MGISLKQLRNLPLLCLLSEGSGTWERMSVVHEEATEQVGGSALPATPTVCQMLLTVTSRSSP